MKAISLWQPWASLVAVGAKWYETRSWPAPQSLIGKRLAICSAKTGKGIDTMHEHEGLVRVCSDFGLLSNLPDSMPMGAIVVVCRVKACYPTEVVAAHSRALSIKPELTEVIRREEICGDWTPGRWGWQLDDFCALNPPIPVVGHQGIFNLSASEEAAVIAQIGGGQ